MSGVTGTSLHRSALYLDFVGHCRDHPVDSLTDTMSDINYTHAMTTPSTWYSEKVAKGFLMISQQNKFDIKFQHITQRFLLFTV